MNENKNQLKDFYSAPYYTEKIRRYLIGGTDANGNNFTPVEVPAGELEKMSWIANNLDASCDLCVVSQVEKHVRCAIKSTARFAEKQYIFSHTGWKKIDGAWQYLCQVSCQGVG